jgi:DNA ligase (NAD+)
MDGTTAIKFEAIVPHESFFQSELSKIYKRPRDVVAAAITSRNMDLIRYVSLIPLRGYIDGKQYIPSPLPESSTCLFCRCDDYTGIESFIKARLDDGATVKINEKTYSIDGVVPSMIYFDGPVVFTRPEYEIAIKILYNVQETKLKSIEYQFGKQGRITPVAILEPVKFDTVTVDHVTLSTLQRVVDMQLRHDDTVRIMYNIVPYFLESYHDGDYPIPVPQNCPICGAKLDYLSYRLVRCSNPNCKGLKLGAIIRHAEKMKMVGVGKGVITKLYDGGFLSKIEDLYDLHTYDDIIPQEVEGIGYQSFLNIINSISKALEEATLPRFLGALSFNDTDEKTWKQILSVVGEDEVVHSLVDGSFPEYIMTVGYIPNVGTMKLQRIIDGYMRNKEEIQSMMEWVPKRLKRVDYQYGKGRKICMTGTRDADLTEALIESGYEVGGWSNDCIAVVVPDLSYTSAKTEKAKAKNIPIYDIKGAYDFLVQPF